MNETGSPLDSGGLMSSLRDGLDTVWLPFLVGVLACGLILLGSYLKMSGRRRSRSRRGRDRGRTTRRQTVEREGKKYTKVTRKRAPSEQKPMSVDDLAEE